MGRFPDRKDDDLRIRGYSVNWVLGTTGGLRSTRLDRRSARL
jgi:hypothetical protein